MSKDTQASTTDLDALLRVLAADGHELAWEEFILSESEWMRSILRQKISRTDLVEDCLQDVLLRVRDALPAYASRQDQQPRAWLRRVCLNVAENLRRSEQARAARERSVAAESHGRLAAATDRLSLDRAEEMKRAVLDLPEAQRRIVELRYLYGLSTRQVAEELGLNYEATKRALSRALQRLRQRLRITAGPVGVLLLTSDLHAAFQGMHKVSNLVGIGVGAGQAQVSSQAGIWKMALVVVLVLGGGFAVAALAFNYESRSDEAMDIHSRRSAAAVSHQWSHAKQVGPPGWVHRVGHTIDCDGHVLVAQSVKYGGQATPAERSDNRHRFALVIEKFDRTGRALWSKEVDSDFVTKVCADPIGRVFICGSRWVHVVSADGSDYTKWELPHGLRGFKSCTAVAASDCSGIYIAGHVGRACGTMDVHKYTATGQRRWKHQLTDVVHEKHQMRVVLNPRADGGIHVLYGRLSQTGQAPYLESITLDRAGTTRSRVRLDDSESCFIYTGGVAVDSSGILFFASNDFLLSWEPNGRIRWRRERAHSFAVSNRSELAILQDGSLVLGHSVEHGSGHAHVISRFDSAGQEIGHVFFTGKDLVGDGKRVQSMVRMAHDAQNRMVVLTQANEGGGMTSTWLQDFHVLPCDTANIEPVPNIH